MESETTGMYYVMPPLTGWAHNQNDPWVGSEQVNRFEPKMNNYPDELMHQVLVDLMKSQEKSSKDIYFTNQNSKSLMVRKTVKDALCVVSTV